MAFHGDFAPVLAKHSKHLNIVDIVAVGVDRMQRNSEPMRKQVETRHQGTRRHDGKGNDIHCIRESDILDFIKDHPQELNLGKVDQTWFLDLLLLKGREVRRAASCRGAEEKEGRRSGQLLENSGDLQVVD